jgi:CRP/FNR family transcriptional regulator, nitrogen oxide reductase regulator
MEGLRGFRTLPAADRAQLAAATHERSYDRGATVFAAGQPADSVWAVKEGLVHIVKYGASGRELVAEVIPPGELFGAIVALENRPYPATAVAAEPSVVWRIPSAVARELCQKYPALRAAILEQVSSRLRSAHERLQSLALEPVEQRFARMLLMLAAKLGQEKDGLRVVNATRQELADMIGTTVETAIRITSKWQRDGVVRAARHQITLADPAALRAIADGSPPCVD